jgi:hypothetical protein
MEPLVLPETPLILEFMREREERREAEAVERRIALFREEKEERKRREQRELLRVRSARRRRAAPRVIYYPLPGLSPRTARVVPEAGEGEGKDEGLTFSASRMFDKLVETW